MLLGIGQEPLEVAISAVENVVGEGQRRSKLLHQLLAAAEGQQHRQSSTAAELGRAERQAGAACKYLCQSAANALHVMQHPCNRSNCSRNLA